MRACALLLVQQACALLRINYTNVTIGNCTDPETVVGGYWVCYNRQVCVLRGNKCHGRIKCIDGEWQKKPNRPEPGCKRKGGEIDDEIFNKDPVSISVPLTVSGICSFFFMVFGTAIGYGVKICNMRRMSYSLSGPAQRYREQEFTFTDARSHNSVPFSAESLIVKPNDYKQPELKPATYI